MAGRRQRSADEVAHCGTRASVCPHARSQRHLGHCVQGGVFFLCLLLAASCADRVQTTPAARGEELRIGFAGANLPAADFGIGQFASFFTFEGLTYPGLDGRAAPRLAESWSWEQNGLRLRVRLRKGVLFHDGTGLTAALAVQILRAALQRQSNLVTYTSLRDVTSISADGPLQLVIDLSRPSAFLPEELSLPFEHGAMQAGTGPYRIASRDRNSLVFERFPAYYLGKAQIERITVRPFDTLRNAWSSLLRGDVDMVSDVQPDAVEFVRTDNVQVISFARGYQYLVAFNSRRRPFTLPAVRHALNLAVNRDSLIADVLKGNGEPATGPLWPRHWAYDATIPPYGYDPRLAETMLDMAGFPVGAAHAADAPPARMRFTCLVPDGFSTLERIALLVQKQLYDIGVDMHFEVVSPADYDARIRQGDFDAVLLDLISGPTFGRPYIFWASAKASKGLNVFGYEDSEAERLFQVLRTSTNEAAIRSATRRLQTVLERDPPALFLAWSKRTRAISRDFRVVTEPDSDPVLTLWQWKADNPSRVLLAR